MPIGEDKYVQKCSTQQSFIFPKFTSFKIGTLIVITKVEESVSHNTNNQRERKSNQQEMAGNYKKEENDLKRSEGLQKLSII